MSDPTHKEQPYRGPWKDENGVCTETCPAFQDAPPRLYPGWKPWMLCRVTERSVESGESTCHVRTMYEAMKRGPDGA